MSLMGQTEKSGRAAGMSAWPPKNGHSCERPLCVTSRPLSTELNRVRDLSLLVQNPDKFLDPFKRLLILFAGIHNAIPIAPQ